MPAFFWKSIATCIFQVEGVSVQHVFSFVFSRLWVHYCPGFLMVAYLVGLLKALFY